MYRVVRRRLSTTDSIQLFSRDEEKESLTTFKDKLYWESKTSWFDDKGVSLLFYAVIANAGSAIEELLKEIQSLNDDLTRKSRLSSRVPRQGIVKFGIPGEMTALMMAMCTSSPDVVSQMLKAGADPFETDKGGYDALMAGTMYVFLSVMFDEEVSLYQTHISLSLMRVLVATRTLRKPTLHYYSRY